jgi:predicted RNA-binding Zn ribbon-like protein
VRALVALLAADRAEVDGLSAVIAVGRGRAVLDHHTADGVFDLGHANASMCFTALAYLAFGWYPPRTEVRSMSRSPRTRPTSMARPSLAVDFANSVACPGCRGADPLDSIREAGRWIRSKVGGDGRRVEARDLPRLRRFREELRQLLGAAADHTPPPPRVLDAINVAAAQSPPLPELSWSHGTWSTGERGTARSVSRRLTALAAQSAIDLLGRTRPPPVRRCEGPGCIHFLVARRSQQRWCSPTGCGNRARVQRHYRKIRSRRDSE